MGGYGSGQWRAARYLTVGKSCVLDTAWFRKHGVLRSGLIAPGRTSWTYDGKTAGSIGWRTDTTANGEHITLTYHVRSREGSWEPIQDRFTFVTTRPHFGGQRWWFQCWCMRRCAKLYLPPRARHFRCRECHRLAYACQRETEADRLIRRASKLQERLDGREWKPKGMHWKTYHRLRGEIGRLQTQALMVAMPSLFPAVLRAGRGVLK